MGEISRLLAKLLDELNYAIERNITSIDTPLEGDVDVLIQRNDYRRFVNRALAADVLVSVTESYGGARLFIECGPRSIKRVDFMWQVHYRGINLLHVSTLLQTRTVDETTALYVLDGRGQALVIDAIKNAYGGAAKYGELLIHYGFHVRDDQERRKWLWRNCLRQPVMSVVGMTAVTLGYIKRMVVPTGLLVYGATARELQGSKVVCYLFQNRISECKFIVSALVKANCFSECCIARGTWYSQIDLTNENTEAEREGAIISHLRKRTKRRVQ